MTTNSRQVYEPYTCWETCLACNGKGTLPCFNEHGICTHDTVCRTCGGAGLIEKKKQAIIDSTNGTFKYTPITFI